MKKSALLVLIILAASVFLMSSTSVYAAGVTVGYVMTFVQSISAQTGNSVKAVQQGWSLSLILFAAVPIALAIAYLYRQSRNGQGWRT